MQGALVINFDLEPIKGITWQRAVCLVLADQATVFLEHDTAMVRSQHLTMRQPVIVMLNRWVHLEEEDRQVAGTASGVRRAVLARDKYRCVYCGQAGATTVDHLLPKCRGGRDTWENLAACCLRCNGQKADRTPEEWVRAGGRRLRWHPWVPKRFAAERALVYRIAAERYGATELAAGVAV
jgi:5-methylcytosine-specific restriction endonuclease McrA